MPPNSVDSLRRLAAKYWSPVVSVGAIGAAAAKLLSRLFGGSNVDLEAWLTVGAILVGALLIRFPRIAAAITRLLLPASDALPSTRAFRGPRPYVEADASNFFGRAGDVEDCLGRLNGAQLFILDGESGSGKTSFLHAGLLPKLRERYAPIVARVTGRPLHQLLEHAVGKGKFDPDKDANADGLCAALRAVQKAGDKPLLICLDQFDELFTLANERVREELFVALKMIIEAELAVVVISIRSDFLDLFLAGCRQVGSSSQALSLDRFFTLQPFSVARAKDVLRRMLLASEEEDPIRKHDLEDFIAELAEQLSRPTRDKRLIHDVIKTVLPVELQIAGYMAESLGSGELSKRLLVKVGGKLGLYRAYIEDVQQHVWRIAGVDGKGCLLILRQLVSVGETRKSATAVTIAEAIGRPETQVQRVLETLCARYVVRAVPSSDPNGPVTQEYELMHDHLGRVLAEAPDRRLQAIRDAEARLAFWRERMSSWNKRPADAGDGGHALVRIGRRIDRLFAQPMPVVEMVVLRKYAYDQESRTAIDMNLRGLVARAIAACILAACAIAGVRAYQASESYQIASVIRDAPIAEVVGQRETNEYKRWIIALAHTQNVERLQEVFQLIKSETTRSEMMALAAEHLALAGSADKAVPLVVESLLLKPSKWSTSHSGAIAATTANGTLELAKDKYAAAVATLQAPLAARVEMHVALALVKAQQASASADLLKEAENKASSMASSVEKIELLLALARMHRDLVQTAMIRSPLDRALDAARQLSPDGLKAEQLANWAGAAADLCCIDEASNILLEATRLERSSWGSGTEAPYKAVGQALARNRRLADVFTIASACEDFACPQLRAALLVGALGGGAAPDTVLPLLDKYPELGVLVFPDMAERAGCDWTESHVLPLVASVAKAERRFSTVNDRLLGVLLKCQLFDRAVQFAYENRSSIVRRPGDFFINATQAIAEHDGTQRLTAVMVDMSKGEQCLLEGMALMGRAKRSEPLDVTSAEKCLVHFVEEGRFRYTKQSPAKVAAFVCGRSLNIKGVSAAIACVGGIKSPEVMTASLRELALIASIESTPDVAFKVTDAIQALDTRHTAVADVMVALAERDMLAAVSLRPMPTFAEDRSRVKCAVAESHARAARFQEARASQQECTSSSAKLRVAAVLIERLLASKNANIEQYLQSTSDDS